MKLLVDLDTGVDDALAMLFLAEAHRNGGVELVGSGAVGGNVEVAQTARNTLNLWDLAGLEIPVAAGAARPLLSPLNTVPHIHGDDGLANTHLGPPRRRPTGEHAVDQILRLSREHAGDLTLLTTGPLTNPAFALLRDPQLADRLQRLVVMGGSLGSGNETPTAEANIYNDPEAARVVFSSGVRVTMVGLDVTHRTYLEEHDVAPLEELDTPRSRFALHLIRHMMEAYRDLGREPQCVLHDPLAAGVCVDPTLVRTRKLHVDVETRGELTRGMTVADRRPAPANSPTVEVALEVDAGRFKRSFLEALLSWARLSDDLAARRAIRAQRPSSSVLIPNSVRSKLAA